MANPLDPAGLYQRYKAAQVGRGLGDLFQEEGPGLGPSSQLSEIISTLRKSGIGQIKSGMDPRIVNPQTERRISEEAQGESLRRIKELTPKGLDAAFAEIQRMQKGPKFAGPEDNLSRLVKSQLRSKEADRINVSRSDSPVTLGVGANELSPLDQIAEKLNKIESGKGAGDEAAAQAMIADKDKAKAAEEFRANEAKIADMQGMPTGDPVETAFIAGLDEFINASRGAGPDAPKPKTIEEYKQIFSDATGIDVSGVVDKSQALMAFGLALMQNRAGKNFNVGKILSAVGKAGEAALPALEKAKDAARQAALAGGKFALEMQSADEAKRAEASEKAMERGNYYIIPKGEGVSGAIANIDKGRLETLSKYEINQLLNNPEFASKYDILPGSTWASVVEEAMKTPEAKDKWLTQGRDIPLIPGVDDDLFKIRVFDPDPNTNPDGNTFMSGDGQQQYEALARMARDNEKAKQKFIELGILNEGTNIFRYGVDSLNSLASAFNIRFGDDEPETMKMKRILQAMAAKEAPRILGESGKTISDGDRQRVAEIVSEITPTSDPRVVQAKLESLFNDIILGAENDISQALSTLDRYTGRNISLALDEGDLSEEEMKELKPVLDAIMGS
jgi:hypothetical protein